MDTKYIENPIITKDIPKDCLIDPCLVENNEKQLGQICDFLQNDKKLLLINGFRGSGKTHVINYATSFIKEDVIVLRYTCIETTIVDDMLLNFFDSFRYYTHQKKIVPPKVKAENFPQKINSYFHSISNPILVIIDSFQSVLKENRSNMVDFVKHLTSFSNIKVVMLSNNFNSEDFDDLEYDKVSILALSQKLFEKVLKNNGIKQIGVLSNELYKQSKGYFNLVTLTINIMNLRQLNLVSFLEKYSKSYMSYAEFVIREALELVDPVSIHLFRLLTVMRIPIHIKLLKSLHLYDQNRVQFFVENSILSTAGDCLYLKDYYRDIIDAQIPDNVRIKLHSSCIDLYNTQLPLKPLERDLLLSRQTMRNEIEYHSLYIPKKPILRKDVREVEIEPSIRQQDELQLVENKKELKNSETTEEKINKISFIIDDEEILDNIANSIKNYVNTTSKNNELKTASAGMGLSQLLNLAKQEEQSFNYKRVVMLYQQALTKTSDDDFYTFLPTIYIKLAKAYQKLSQWYEALEYFTQAQDFYSNISNIEKVYEIKLEIANIYYIMYKHDNAKFILSELEKSETLPDELRIKVNILSAKLSTGPNTEYKYYKNSIPLVKYNTDKTVISELYYKYAAVCDELDKPKTAAQYYKKCIDIDSNPQVNPYMSRALSNLADLYDEAGATNHAIDYYNKSVKIDIETNNYNGLYQSYVHLSEIYSPTDSEKALEFLNKALDCAKILKEPFYIADTLLNIGDFYFLRRKTELAYEQFIEAYKIAQKTFSKDNIDKIQARINDVKRRLTEQQYKALQEKYGK